MSIVIPKQAQIFALSEILTASFRIPNFQRLYAWGQPQWKALANDLTESWTHSKKPLFLGMCVLAKEGDVYDVIDGQQRLTTLGLLLGALGDSSVLRQFDDGRSQTYISPQEPDGSWLLKILGGETLGAPARYSQRLMLEAHRFFSEGGFEFDASFVKSSELILYCAPSIYGSTSMFERINSRGKKVSILELVKNRLFNWSSRINSDDIRIPLETDIVERFASVFSHVNPCAEEAEIDTDSLLRTHWILFDEDHTKTTDFAEMTREIDGYLNAEKAEGSMDGKSDEVEIAKKFAIISVHWKPLLYAGERSRLRTTSRQNTGL
jgi:hypothetical protein